MTSSAASDTLSARNTTSGCAGRTLRSTSAPPPSGMWTSSSTTSGRRCAIPATASATEPASPTTVTSGTLRSSSARTPERNRAWSSTRKTRTGWPARSWSACSFSSTAAIGTSASAGAPRCPRPCPAAQPDRTAVPGHPAAHGVGQAVPVVGDGVGVEPGPAVADEHVHLVRLDLGVHADLVHPGVLGRVDHRLAGGQHEGAQVVVQRSGPRRRPRGARRARRCPRPRRPPRRARRSGPRPPGRTPRTPVPAGPVQPVSAARAPGRGPAAHLAGRVGLALDQREGLQHGVVQVRGDLRALGLAGCARGAPRRGRAPAAPTTAR